MLILVRFQVNSGSFDNIDVIGPSADAVPKPVYLSYGTFSRQLPVTRPLKQKNSSNDLPKLLSDYFLPSSAQFDGSNVDGGVFRDNHDTERILKLVKILKEVQEISSDYPKAATVETAHLEDKNEQ